MFAFVFTSHRNNFQKSHGNKWLVLRSSTTPWQQISLHHLKWSASLSNPWDRNYLKTSLHSLMKRNWLVSPLVVIGTCKSDTSMRSHRLLRALPSNPTTLCTKVMPIKYNTIFITTRRIAVIFVWLKENFGLSGTLNRIIKSLSTGSVPNMLNLYLVLLYLHVIRNGSICTKKTFQIIVIMMISTTLPSSNYLNTLRGTQNKSKLFSHTYFIGSHRFGIGKNNKSV